MTQPSRARGPAHGATGTETAGARASRRTSADPELLLQRAQAAEQSLRYRDAIRTYERLLALHRASRNRRLEAETLHRIAAVCAYVAQPERGLEALREALPLWRDLGDTAGEAGVFLETATLGAMLLTPGGVLPYAERAAELYRSIGDDAGEGRALACAGLARHGMHQRDIALDYCRRALDLCRRAGDKRGEADALYNVADIYCFMEQAEQFRAYAEGALTLYREISDRKGEARALAVLGEAYHFGGRFLQAYVHLREGAALARLAGEPYAEAIALNQLGVGLSRAGEHEDALRLTRQAVDAAKRGGQNTHAGFYLSNVAALCLAIGRPRRALRYAHESAAICHEYGNSIGEARAWLYIGDAYARLGQSDEARGYYERSLDQSRRIGAKSEEVGGLYGLARLLHEGGRFQEALELSEQALLVPKAIGRDLPPSALLTAIAAILESQNRLGEAEGYLLDAIRTVEALREAVGSMSWARVSALGSQFGPYSRCIALRMRRNDPAGAFELVERGKARALLDILYGEKVDLLSSLTDEEKQHEQGLRDQADALNAEIIRLGVRNEPGAKKRCRELKLQLAEAENDLRKLADEAAARQPDVARKRSGSPATLASVARYLPPRTALLEHVILTLGDGLKARDRCALFIVTGERARRSSGAARRADLTVHPVRVCAASLARRIDALRSACATPGDAWQNEARVLYRLLLGHAEAQLAGISRLVLCPDGPLWDVPFAALLDDQGRTLAERFELSYTYSAGVAQAAAAARRRADRPKPAKGLLALAAPHFGGEERFGPKDEPPGARPITAPGRPILAPSRPILAPARCAADLCLRGAKLSPLPGARREAEAIRKGFADALVLTGRRAQEAAAKREMGRYRYLHFATHGFFNDAAPLLSSLVLADPPKEGPGSNEDGFLTARELLDMDLSAEMAVLSACNSARGSKRTGEGLVGLTWALFAAGVPTQVLAQWAVDDEAAATLMTSFYAGIMAGKPKGAALREAALALKNDGKHGHPYYWAPWVLMGDWR